MPLLFEMYFKCGFCIDKFKKTYEPYILDEYIKRYINDLTQNEQSKLCFEILQKYKRSNRKLREFKFDKRYPNDKMVGKMKQMIKKYLFVKHSQNQGYRFECERLIIRELEILIANDIEFGKPLIKKCKRLTSQIVFEPLLHLNNFQIDPLTEVIMNPFKDFELNEYQFAEETFIFAPPVICDKVDDKFMQRMNEINRAREYQEFERERMVREISRRRNDIGSQSMDVSGNHMENTHSIYNLINEIMNDYVDQHNNNTGRPNTSSSIRRRIDFNAVRNTETDSIITGTYGRLTGMRFNENVSESGSINNDFHNDDELDGEIEDGEIEDGEIEDGEIEDGDIFDDDLTNTNMLELISNDSHDESQIEEPESDEEIFAIDYDTTRNVVTRSPYNNIENSFIHSTPYTYSDNNNLSISSMEITVNINVPAIGSSNMQLPLHYDYDEDTDDEGYMNP